MADEKKQFVVFATPSKDGKVVLGYLTSFGRTIRLLNEHDIGWDHASIGNDPYLTKCRNGFVLPILQAMPQMTDLFFLDDDIEWDAKGVLKLLQDPRPIVSGIYPKKSDTVDFPVELSFEGGEEVDGVMKGGDLVERDGWYKARKVPTGFLRIKREVLEAMVAGLPRYKDPTLGNMIVSNVFQGGFSGDKVEKTGLGEWWGEDYLFCEMAAQMGYEIWVWPDINFGHTGPKTWTGNLLQRIKGGAEHGEFRVVKMSSNAEPETFKHQRAKEAA